MTRYENSQAADMPQHANDSASNMPGHANDRAADMPPPVRATIEEAAKLLGLSENAIRKRIERGTLRSEKVKGTRYVLLDGDMPQHADDEPASMPSGMSDMSGSMSALVDSLEEQIEYMRAQLAEEREARRRADTIIAQLTQANATLAQRVPELEPSQARGSPVSSEEEQGSTSPPQEQQEPTQRRSWLYRFFFGP